MPEPAQFVQFGSYLLDEEIARGGMARVYRARLRGLGGFEKTLVVKQILPDLAQDPRFVAMFVEEAKVVVQMSHPHIVPVYELGVVDGVYFLAMEYVRGATLADVLRSGPLPPSMVAHVGAQVTDALHYAHTRFGVVHRDVTPRNVILDATGHARLLDFGIAAPAGPGSAEAFGSPGYMSPEQVEGLPVNQRSDIFSLGTVLFEAITGEHAFLRTTEAETKAAVLERDPPRLAGRSGVPQDLAAIVDTTLRRVAGERPPAEQLGRELRGWLAKTRPQGVGSELGTRVEVAAEAKQRRTRSQPAAAGAKGPGDGREPSRIVRTIATSPMLEAMLEGDVGARPVPATGEGDVLQQSTQKLDRPRAIAPPEDALDPDTRPLTPARRAAEAPALRALEDPEDDEPGAVEAAGTIEAVRGEEPAPVETGRSSLAPPRRSRWRQALPLVAALGAGAMLALILPPLFADDGRGATTAGPDRPDRPGPPEKQPAMEETTPPAMEEATPPAMEEATPPTMEEATPPTMEEITPPTMEETTPPTMEDDTETPPAGSARITLSAYPSGVATVNGRSRPLRRAHSLLPGTYRVVFRNEAYADLATTVTVAAGQSVTVIANFQTGSVSQR